MPPSVRPVAEWPKLLAGPMVRRVTSEAAHFFVATSVEATIEIRLYDGHVAHSSTAHVATSGATELTRIGELLWVGVVGVDIPGTLSAGAVVGYDVILREADGAREWNLFDLGLLGGPRNAVDGRHGAAHSQYDPRRAAYPLGYAEGRLPSFVKPVDDVSDLRLVHGSCRKPHGGKGKEADALQLLDAELANLLTSSGGGASERPQQLFLTGDQIYADDVAAGLLVACTEAATQLLGWNEELPFANGNLSALADPYWRTRLLSLDDIDLKDIPDKVEDDYSANHLLRFGEWCAMYLLAWSDALWPVDSDGDYTLPAAPSRLPLGAIRLALDAAELAGFVAVPARVGQALDVVEMLDGYAKECAEHWAKTREKVLGYAASTCSARRALANVATYTMFDDHEITDDWFLNRRVHDRLKGVGSSGERAEVGPRLLRNGLSAYAVFQHWGNAPEDFAPGRQGRQLLDLWTRGDSSPATLTTDGHTRDADTLLGIVPGDSPAPPPGAGSTFSRQAFARIRWDYAVGFPAHRLVALDTRTWRHFPAGGPITWASLGPLTPNAPGAAMTAGGTQLAAVADAWRQAGTSAGSAVHGAFADVVDAYVVAVSDVEASASVLRTRVAGAIAATTTFVQTLPSRAAITAEERRDPFLSHLWTVISDPARMDEVLDVFSTPQELLGLLTGVTRDAVTVDFGPGTRQLTVVMEALADFVDAAVARSSTGMARAAATAAHEMTDDLWEALSTVPTSHAAHTQLLAALQVSLEGLDALVAASGIDQLTQGLLRDGSNRLGAGLIREDALRWMVSQPLREVAPSVDVTLLLSPAPVFGNRVVEMAQRFAVAKQVLAGQAGEENVDFEAWSVNTPAMCDLFEAAQSLRSAVVLSGDVHYAGSSVNDVSLLQPLPPGAMGPPHAVRTRYVQLTSSSSRNSDGKTRTLAHMDDLLYDDDGTFVLFQSDWMSLLEHGASSYEHLGRLSRAELEARLDALRELPGDALHAVREWWQDDIDWGAYRTIVERAVTAPVNSARAWALEAAWKIGSSIEMVQEFADDPVLAVFGDFLTAGAPTRQLLRDLYRDLGIDTSAGLTVHETILFDRRPSRLPLYPAAARYRTGTDAYDQVDDQERRTVGHANLGFVRFVTRAGEVLEVQQELRWYPEDEPAGRASPRAAAPRGDWYGTLHRAGWYGVPADVARGRP